jgi:hypothetical protein
MLSFMVVNRAGQAPELSGIPIGRAALARSGATQAPVAFVRSVLSPEWKEVLAGYVPEPFRHLSSGPGP